MQTWAGSVSQTGAGRKSKHVGSRAHMAAISLKGVAANRQAYAQRLRTRLQGLRTAGEVWRMAYLAGYRAAYASYLAKVRRGEVIAVKERRVRNWHAA